MKLKFNKNFLVILTIVMSCFINLALPMVIWAMPVSLIVLYFSIIVFFIAKRKSIISFINKFILSKKNLFRPFIAFLLYITITSLLFVSTGKIEFIDNFFPFIGGVVFQIFLGMLFAAYFTYKECSIKFLLKTLYVTVYIIILIGVYDFIICALNITPLIDAIQWFANDRTFLAGGEMSLERAYVGNLARIESIFDEPAIFASFIAFFLPMIYTFSLSKYSIFSSKIIDKFVKISFVPFTWFNIIFTQSPIYLVICIVITIIYFHKILLKKIKYVLLVIVLGVAAIILYTGFHDLDISDTFLQRITTVLSTFGDFDRFVEEEPSLATRIVNYYNILCVWGQYPIFGTGLGGLVEKMQYQIVLSNVPLTKEIVTNYLKNGRFSFNSGFFYKYIAETGIIGITLIYYFLINIIKNLIKIVKMLPNSIEKDFCSAMYRTIITFICLTFYNIGYLYLFIWIVVGISIGVCYKIKENIYIEENINCEK